MRLAPQFGHDTGMYLVDVFLETDEETALSEVELWARAAALLRSAAIDPGAVVDLFPQVRNGAGEWVSAIRNADGKLVPVHW